MDLFKIPACWPTTFLFGIPLTGKIKFINSEMLSKENQIESRYKPINYYSNVKIDLNLLDFIFQFCKVKLFFNKGRQFK